MLGKYYHLALIGLFLLPAELNAQSGKIIYTYSSPALLSKNKIREVFIAEGPEQTLVEHYYFNSSGFPHKLVIQDHKSPKAGPLIREISYNPDSTYRKFTAIRCKTPNDTVLYYRYETFYSATGKEIREIRMENTENPTLSINLFDSLNKDFVDQTNYYFSPEWKDTLKRVTHRRNDHSGLFLLEEKENQVWVEKQKHIHKIQKGQIVYAEEFENGKLKREYQLPDTNRQKKWVEEENFNALPFNDKPRVDTLKTKDISPYAKYVQADREKEYLVVITYQLMNREKVESYEIIHKKTGLVLEINYPAYPLSSKKFEYAYYSKNKK